MMVRKLIRAGALAALVCAGTAQAVTDDVPAPHLPLRPPAVPADRLARGGWTASGWSDEVPASSVRAGDDSGRNGGGSPAEDRSVTAEPVRADAGPVETVVISQADGQPLSPEASDDAAGPDGSRETWDGGRGPAFRYARGKRLPAAFLDPAYTVADWRGYGLAPPPAGAAWVRYFDDAVLVGRDGVVVDAVPRVGWARSRPSHAAQQEPAAWQGGGTYTFQAGPGTTVHHLPNGSTVTVTTVTTPATRNETGER